MSRQIGSKNVTKLPPEIVMSEAQRLELIAKLLLEIFEEELNKNKANYATNS